MDLHEYTFFSHLHRGSIKQGYTISYKGLGFFSACIKYPPPHPLLEVLVVLISSLLISTLSPEELEIFPGIQLLC